MNTDKINLLRAFVSSLETDDAGTQNAILEALDAFEDSEDASDGDENPLASDPNGGKPATHQNDIAGVEIHWEVLLDSLKALVEDEEASEMQVTLRNSMGDTYYIFKKNKVGFVTNASGDVKSETDEPEKEGSKFLGKQSHS